MQKAILIALLAMLTGCNINEPPPEPSDFYLFCVYEGPPNSAPTVGRYQIKPATGEIFGLRDGIYQSPCNQPLYECGETLITDSLISQSLDYPGDDGSRMRMDFRLDRISGELTNTYTRNGELDGVATATCERSETPPVPKI